MIEPMTSQTSPNGRAGSDDTDSLPGPTVVALSGNPRPGSRTAALAREVAAVVSARMAGHRHVVEIDLANPPAPADHLRARLASADVAVVASPTYKATYTGLLKSFLDGFGPLGLDRVVAVPVMVAGDRAHAMAVDAHLRPLLLELGATCPTPGLFVAESELAEPPIDRWLERAGWALDALVREAVPA
jgi:FMN reductase